MKTSLTLIYFLILSTLVSCNHKVTVKVEKETSILSNLETKVDNTEVILWPRGVARKNSVTQGVVVRIKVPQISKDDGQALFKRHHINSWILKINRQQAGRAQPIGYLNIPFFAKTTKRASAYYKIQHAFFEISYAAAYTSARFREFDCPAFGHNRKVSDVTISYGNAFSDSISSGYPHEFNSKVEPVGIIPTKFNAGNSIAGTYSVELGLFDSDTGNLHGDFIAVDGLINIPIEETAVLPGCPTGEEFYPPSPGTDIRKFKFNP